MGEASLIAAARAGEEEAFVRLTAPYRSALHAHCYRLLGSLHDADDGLQETLLRAWRGIGGLEPPAQLGGWLHRIATNVCLRMLERRRRQHGGELAHLEPFPELDDVPSHEPGPETVVEEREAIGLAFVAAMQLLPAKQRAVLVLRDVLGWPARDVAAALEDSVAAVNSALQRARARLDDGGGLPRPHAPASPGAEAEAMRRFQEAWAAVDVEALVALLADDALLTMPPDDVRIEGARAIGEFFATQPLGGRLDRIALRPTRANGQPALAAYADELDDGRLEPYGVMVFSLAGDEIAGIVGFPRRPDLFVRLGLPERLEGL